MLDLPSLASHVGKVVDLAFADGQVVRAKLVTVDQDEPAEVIYDVVEELSRGSGPPVRPGEVKAAPASALRGFHPR